MSESTRCGFCTRQINTPGSNFTWVINFSDYEFKLVNGYKHLMNLSWASVWLLWFSVWPLSSPCLLNILSSFLFSHSGATKVSREAQQLPLKVKCLFCIFKFNWTMKLGMQSGKSVEIEIFDVDKIDET